MPLKVVALTAAAAGFGCLTNHVAHADPPGDTTEAPLIRHVSFTASLSRSSSSFAYTATMRPNDPELLKLMSAMENLPTLIQVTTGSLLFDGSQAAALFVDAEPTIAVTPTFVTVTATENLPYDPIGSHLVGVTVSHSPEPTSALTFTLAFPDHQATSYDPLPDSTSGRTATWDLAPGWISVAVAADWVGDVRAGDLGALLPHPFGYLIPSALFAVLLGVALVWALWLVRHLEPSYPGPRKRISLFLLAALGATFAFPLLEASGYEAGVDCRHLCLMGSSYTSLLSDLSIRDALAFLGVAGLLSAFGCLPLPRGVKVVARYVAIGLALAAFDALLVSLLAKLPHAGALDYRVATLFLVFPVAAPLALLAPRLSKLQGPWGTAAWVVLSLAATLIITLPFHTIAPAIGGPIPSSELAFQGLPALLALMTTAVLPTVAAAGIIFWLNQDTNDRKLEPRFVVSVGFFLFAGYLVGTTSNWLFIPIPFLIALVAYYRLLLAPQLERDILDRVSKTVRDGQPKFVRATLLRATALRFRSAFRVLEGKVASGDLSTTQYSAQRRVMETYIANQLDEPDLRDDAGLPQPKVKGSGLAFAVAPNPSPVVTAGKALRTGAIPAIAFAVVAAGGAIVDNTFARDPFPQMELAARGIATLGYWLIGAFTFGYLFTYIRGHTGMTKGLRFAAVLILASLPVRLLLLRSLFDVGSILLTASETLGFYALIGLIFDFRVFRTAQGAVFRASEFWRLGDLRGFTTILTVVGTTVGVALSSAIAGQLANILGTLLQGALGHPSGM